MMGTEHERMRPNENKISYFASFREQAAYRGAERLVICPLSSDLLPKDAPESFRG
jgi:hypothetical protein